MISIVIPVYNEGGCLPDGIEAMRAVLAPLVGNEWEFVLVDDGSTDDTRARIEGLAAADERVHAVHHAENQGKGAAVRSGVLHSTGDMVLFCDADMSTPPDTLAPFVEALRGGADVVIGNRKSKQATIERWQPPIRTWLGLGFTKLANAVTGLRINDYTCGFKLFRGDAAREIFEATQTSRWGFDVEILARAVQAGLQIREIPVHWRHMDDTRVRVLRDVISSFLELLAIRRRLGRVPRDRG